MPGVFGPANSRRAFLQSVAGGALFLKSRAGASARSARWALLSDTHTPEDAANEYRGFRPYDNLRTAVPKVIEAGPEGAVITGDLARLIGTQGDYRNLRTLLEPLAAEMPVAMALGNHDDRKNFLDAFAAPHGARQEVRGKYVAVVDAGPVRMVVLDSLLAVNITPGQLGNAQREWLDTYLRSSDDRPTLLLVHHTLNQNDTALVDVDRMYEVIAPHKKVKAIVFGHSHVYGYSERERIHEVNLPAIGYNFRDTDPVGWVEATLTAEGGEFKLHAFAGNRADHGKTVSLAWRR